MNNETDFLNKLASQTQSGEYMFEQSFSLSKACWDMLEEDVKRAFLNNQSIAIDEKPKTKEEFANSIKRLQNNFSPYQMEEAIENFRFLDKSKYSKEHKLFNDSIIIAETFKHEVLKKSGPTIATHLATMTTADVIDQESLSRITATLLAEIVSDKKGKADVNFIDKHGRIHSNLVISLADYCNKNLNELSTLNHEELKVVGRDLKKSCAKIDLRPENRNIAMIKKVINAMSTILLGEERELEQTILLKKKIAERIISPKSNFVRSVKNIFSSSGLTNKARTSPTQRQQ